MYHRICTRHFLAWRTRNNTQEMTRIPGKWLCLLSELLHMLHHVLFPTSVLAWSLHAGMGFWLGWSTMTLLLRSHPSSARGRARWLWSSSASASVSSRVCQSINDWCPQDLTRLSPAACLTAVHWATGPNAPTYTPLKNMSAPQRICAFWRVQRLMYNMPQTFIWITSPSWVYSLLFVPFLHVGRKFKRCWLYLVYAICIIVL